MKIILLGILFCFSLRSEEPAVYRQLSNLYDPTIEDYQRVQEYLSHGQRPLLQRLKDVEPSMRAFKLIGNTPEEMPQVGKLALRCSEEERENCIILYSSFNQNYPNGLKRLVQAISKSDFRGHVYYRFGGWPNTAAGDLVLAHVPFAFKICFFREVQALGYKRALWLDTSILPVPTMSLNRIFSMIEQQGHFIQKNTHEIGPFMNEEAARAFGLDLQQAADIPSIPAAILGFDFTHPVMLQVLDKLYKAAHDPIAFYSARSDQNALSIILHQLQIPNLLPAKSLGSTDHIRKKLYRGIYFVLDREFVKEVH